MAAVQVNDVISTRKQPGRHKRRPYDGSQALKKRSEERGNVDRATLRPHEVGGKTALQKTRRQLGSSDFHEDFILSFNYQPSFWNVKNGYLRSLLSIEHKEPWMAGFHVIAFKRARLTEHCNMNQQRHVRLFFTFNSAKDLMVRTEP